MSLDNLSCEENGTGLFSDHLILKCLNDENGDLAGGRFDPHRVS
jgi:hypothetical protein